MAGLDAFGTQLQRGDGGGPEVFTAIANCSSITPPALSRETYDVTAHDSPDKWREHLGGLKDGGEFSAELHYDPSKHDSLAADLDDDDPRNYKIVFPSAIATWSFKGILTGFEPEAPVDGQLAATVTFKVTGKPVLT